MNKIKFIDNDVFLKKDDDFKKNIILNNYFIIWNINVIIVQFSN